MTFRLDGNKENETIYVSGSHIEITRNHSTTTTPLPWASVWFGSCVVGFKDDDIPVGQCLDFLTFPIRFETLK